MINVNNVLAVRSLFKKFTHEQIMEKITGVPVTEKRFSSPFRVDNKASCSYYYNNREEVCFKDFGRYLYGNVYNIMAYRLGLLTNNKIPQESLSIVENALCELMEGQNAWSDEELSIKDFSKVSHNIGTIDWKWRTREWKQYDVDYWSKYGVPFYFADNGKIFCPLLNEYNVIPVDNVWINGNIIYPLQDKKNNPTYIYKIKNLDNKGYSYKCYKPLDPTKDWKWRSTSARFNPIQGLEQINKDDKVFICTSLKDSIVFYLLTGHRAIAFPCETSIPNSLPTTIEGYISDSDWPGMRIAVNFKEKFSLPIYHLPMSMKKDLGVKDISDLVALWGIQKTKNYVNSRK